MLPKVSVIVPVYNAGSYLLPSIASLVRQTYGNLEILIIDDGSVDGCLRSLDRLRDSRIRIIRQSHGGRPRALNRGIGELSGEFYATHDADDISHPARIARQIEFLHENPMLSAVFCGNELIIEGRHVAPIFHAKGVDECYSDIMQMAMPAHDTTGMFRVSMVRGITYDESLPFVEAYDYILRVGERMPMAVIGECLYSYRVHYRSITRRDPFQRIRFVEEARRRAILRRGVRTASESGSSTDTSGSRVMRNRDRDNNIAAYFMESVLDLRRAHRRWDAVRTALACSSLHPFDPHYHKALFYAIAPQSIVTRLRKEHSYS